MQNTQSNLKHDENTKSKNNKTKNRTCKTHSQTSSMMKILKARTTKQKQPHAKHTVKPQA
jgi:hypothetical protein